MNLKKITRKALMSCFFLLMFAIRPGFGKLDLENYDIDRNGGWNRLTDEIRNFKEVNYGFELHCAGGKVKEADIYTKENKGLLTTAYIE